MPPPITIFTILKNSDFWIFPSPLWSMALIKVPACR